MTQPEPENWDQGQENLDQGLGSEIAADVARSTPAQSWPPPPPRDPGKPEQPQLRLVSPDGGPSDQPQPAAALRSLGLSRPSATSDLDSELQAAREELHALHELLEELPAIFETKFQHRLQGALKDQQRLLGENQELRRGLSKLLPDGVLPVTKPSPRLMLPPALERAGSLGQTLRQVLRRSREAGSAPNPESTSGQELGSLVPGPLAETSGAAGPLSPDDDGPPKAASADPTRR